MHKPSPAPFPIDVRDLLEHVAERLDVAGAGTHRLELEFKDGRLTKAYRHEGPIGATALTERDAGGIRELVLPVARENPRWGYQRIVGELAGVGVQIGATTVRTILRQAGVPPAETRAVLCWRQFVRVIHDRDSKFSNVFDDVFRSESIEIIRTPFRAPKANAFAERWVGTIRRDCLDWILIVSRPQLEHVLRVYVQQPQATPNSWPNTPNSRAATTPCQSRFSGSRPQTRSPRRAYPRIRRSSVTDGFAHPTRCRPDRAALALAPRLAARDVPVIAFGTQAFGVVLAPRLRARMKRDRSC